MVGGFEGRSPAVPQKCDGMQPVVSEGNDPRRKGSRGAAAGAARDAREVIRVFDKAEVWMGARTPQCELVHVGLGKQNGALPEDHVGERRIRFRAIVLEESRSRGGGEGDRVDLGFHQLRT